MFGPNIIFSIKIYYAKKFHAIRHIICGDHQNFILSIARSQIQTHQLGKSGSRFSYSHDKKYIVKAIKEREFKMFLDLAQNYFRHVCKSFFH